MAEDHLMENDGAAGVARFLFVGEFMEEDGEVWLSTDLMQGYNRSRALICLAEAG